MAESSIFKSTIGIFLLLIGLFLIILGVVTYVFVVPLDWMILVYPYLWSLWFVGGIIVLAAIFVMIAARAKTGKVYD